MVMQTEHVVRFHSDTKVSGTRLVLKLALIDIGVPRRQFTKKTTNGDYVNLFKTRHIYPVIFIQLLNRVFIVNWS